MFIKNITSKIIISLSLLSCILIACEKEIPFDGELIKSKLVIHAFLEANDSVLVHAGNSLSIKSPASAKINETASIKIFNNNTLVANFVHDSSGFYKPLAPFKPVPGTNYRLEASSPGLDPIKSSETIPFPVDVIVDTMSVPSSNGSGNGSTNLTLRFNLTFNDIPSVKNYYSIEIFTIDTFDNWPDTLDHHIYKNTVYASTNDRSVEKIYSSDLGDEGSIESNIFLLRDDLFEGKSHTISLTDKWGSQSNDYKKTYIIEFKSITENYFNHVLSKEKYYYADDDPFSQPVQIFNNIENGLGIFAGYALVTKRIIY